MFDSFERKLKIKTNVLVNEMCNNTGKGRPCKIGLIKIAKTRLMRKKILRGKPRRRRKNSVKDQLADVKRNRYSQALNDNVWNNDDIFINLPRTIDPRAI